jgi:hypothetical protein
MKNIQIRKFTRTNTKKALKRVLKELIVKNYIYSIKEAQRLGLEYRELMYYLKPYLIEKTATNLD